MGWFKNFEFEVTGKSDSILANDPDTRKVGVDKATQSCINQRIKGKWDS